VSELASERSTVSTIDIRDASGKKSGTVDLPAEIFDVQVNIPLIHQVVVAQQAAARQGTHSTKTRGEVAGGGRKPYRQKGTGRARQGSNRAPQYAGGGIVHGPTPHGYDQRTPKKMKAAALRGALSDRARDSRVHVVSALIEGEAPSTKQALAALAKITERPRTLVVLERGDDVTWLSLRNVDTIHILNVDQLNTYDVLLSDDVVFLKGAYDQFVAGPATGKSIKAVASSSEPEAVVDVVEEKPKAAKKATSKKAAVSKTADAEVEAPVVEVETTDEPVVEEKPKAAKKSPAKKSPAKKAAAKKSPAKKAAAKKSAADEADEESEEAK
jgi:large subunit ribosomal protein L4